MGAYRTPLIDKLKTDSATFYTFGSPIEDIGLNINERTTILILKKSQSSRIKMILLKRESRR